MPVMHDPRPLTGEPLALDLVDTVWVDETGERQDLLIDRELRSAWLARWGLPDAPGRAQASHLLETRDAIRGVLERRGDPTAAAAVDAALARGRLRLSFTG